MVAAKGAIICKTNEYPMERRPYAKEALSGLGPLGAVAGGGGGGMEDAFGARAASPHLHFSSLAPQSPGFTVRQLVEYIDWVTIFLQVDLGWWQPWISMLSGD